MSNIASQVTKKRKYSDSPTGTLNSGMIHGMNGILSIKQEPPGDCLSCPLMGYETCGYI